MRRTLTILAVLLVVATTAAGQRRGPRRPGPGGELSPPLAKTEVEKRILAVLNEAVKAGALYANVPAADGRMLRLLAETVNARSVVEIGTSTGLSGLWFCLALEKTGGRLTTFEIDPGRAATAMAHFKKAGVDRLVTLVQGDAHQTVARLKDPIDIVFVDADKDGYVDYLNKLLPLIRPGGLIIAHNIDSAPEYLTAVTTNPDLETVLPAQAGNGMAVTLKKR